MHPSLRFLVRHSSPVAQVPASPRYSLWAGRVPRVDAPAGWQVPQGPCILVLPFSQPCHDYAPAPAAPHFLVGHTNL